MASTTTVELRGGPCDGQTKQLTLKQLATQKTWCGGKLYVYQSSLATIRQPYVYELQADVTAKSKPPDTTAVTQAWSRWMKALAHRGPDAYRRTLKATVRVRRIAR